MIVGLGVSCSGGCTGAGTIIGDGGFPSPSHIAAASNSSTGIDTNVQNILIVNKKKRGGNDNANLMHYNKQHSKLSFNWFAYYQTFNSLLQITKPFLTFISKVVLLLTTLLFLLQRLKFQFLVFIDCISGAFLQGDISYFICLSLLQMHRGI